ncbi:urease accessory protein UreD [Sporosarcina ureilytica]|uniref:Urease accessory protein UreD n=1 Tax=Sporosarcina ureilytica TaxID=298596 RepID=A0A1D8JF28_9BACL|nr:urease accessory protein UreD [Sporosarcina ureilytica]AOV07320.1 hypothetical protein BI350_07045 [Sporosarcina ureilytica]
MNLQASPNKRPKHDGRLSMEFQYRGNKTVLSNCYQNPPLRASRPLYINPANRSEATVYLVETSGGIVEGDHNVFEIDIKEGADVCLIPQSATKIYPSYNDIWSSQNMDISIGPKASLSFKTEALIPFEQARFNGKTVIQMAKDSTLLWGDILSPGRVARGEVFEYTDVRTNFQVWVDDECLIYDPLLISKDNMGLKNMGMLEEHLFIGSMWFVTPTIEDFDIRELNERLQESPHSKASASMLEGKAVNVRWLASDLVDLKKEMHRIWDEFASYIV